MVETQKSDVTDQTQINIRLVRLGQGAEAHLLFQLLLCLSNPGHLRVSVDDGGDAVVVDVNSTTSHALHTDDALVLSFVSQHWTSNNVPDGVNTRRKRSKDISLPATSCNRNLSKRI